MHLLSSVSSLMIAYLGNIQIAHITSVVSQSISIVIYCHILIFVLGPQCVRVLRPLLSALQPLCLIFTMKALRNMFFFKDRACVSKGTRVNVHRVQIYVIFQYKNCEGLLLLHHHFAIVPFMFMWDECSALWLGVKD